MLKKDINFKTCLFNCDNSLVDQSELIKNFENNLCKEIINNNNNISYVLSDEALINWITKFKIKNLIIPYETEGKCLLNRKSLLNKFTNNNVNVFFI